MAIKDLIGAAVDGLSSAKSGSSRSIMRFQLIDIDDTARKLKLEELGQKNGENNLPRSDSTNLDAVEQGIVEEVSNLKKFYYQEYLGYAKTYAQRLSEMNPKTKKDLIRSEAATGIGVLEKETRIALNKLVPARDNAIDLGEGLRDFKNDHKIRRPAKRYNKNKALGIGFLALIALTEAILNGTFLAKGSELGLLGGVVEALTLALVNILIAAFAGRIIMPHMQYRGFLKASAAWIGFVAYLGIAVYFNLLVGHYRDATGADPLEAAVAAWRSAQANPLGITDLRSWFLVGMGFVFSIAALIDTFVMDDPYPGYGAIYRQWRDAAETYYALHQQESDALQAQLDHTREQLDELLKSVESSDSNRMSVITNAQAMKDSMRDYEDHAEKSLNLLIKIYREANMAARKEPPPKRFVDSEPVKLAPLNLDTINFGQADLTATGADIEDAADVHRAAMAEVMAAYKAAQGSFDALRDLMRERKVPASKDEAVE